MDEVRTYESPRTLTLTRAEALATDLERSTREGITIMQWLAAPPYLPPNKSKQSFLTKNEKKKKMSLGLGLEKTLTGLK